MEPPEATAEAVRPPAVSVCLNPMETLRKRADFLACARARKAPCPAFLVQGRKRAEGEAVRVGFTASKKVGNAVARNRAKRRLRALARSVIAAQGKPGWDYVLVARKDATATRPFAEMEQDLTRALHRLHTPRR